MNRTLAALLVVLLAATTQTFAQSNPFDMSGERPAAEPPVEMPKQEGGGGQPAIQPDAGADTLSGGARHDFRRYIVPFDALSLSGEVDERTWSMYLTPAQAQSPATLNFGYQNAIVIAPEVSSLSVFVNGELVGEGPIKASDTPEERSYELRAGLLRPGSNDIRFRVQQRHRTDCTIESTYELWTEIAPDTAFISFADAESAVFASVDDIRAVGVDGNGRTRFNLVVPGMAQPSRTADMMRLAQGLALRGHMPAQRVILSQGLPELGKPGELTVVAGTVDEVSPLLAALPDGAAGGSVTAFVHDDKTNAPVLVLSGPDWPAVRAAIEAVAEPMDRPSEVPRDIINTERWLLPETPVVAGSTRLRFSELGVATSEFTGRRFRSKFSVAVPSDFYADAYGEATILLDAAYTETVLPGSRIDIYVNGNIASTVPFDSATGGILRHLPINVTMRHFRPGPNLIELEAVLLTEQDKVCAPGAPASTDSRFALFDTSELHMPNFARIGLRPNLAALSGAAAPYRNSAGTIPLFIDRADADTLSAAATFLARLAVAGGRPIAVETIVSPLAAGTRNALFVGTLPELPKTVLTQVGIDPSRQMSWGSAQATGRGEDTQKAIDEWQTRLSGGAWRTQITALQNWVKQEFDISLSSLRILPQEQADFAPPETATLLIAQGANPTDDATWTLVAAPTAKLLSDGVSAVSDIRQWQRIAGHISTYEPASGAINVVPVTNFEFVQTRPASIGNYRLIIANWLSSNILFYAVALVVLSVLLGLATSSMLSRLGRRP
ncbi:cellulose biosynthesis cyclic di-GMP-binding regulatory protein BcsB [Ensifer sp. HO-A22]|uniref:Cyclic di-GMP-binding protein n=1 Tax=Ensifer oleiphilus TaxID=2742698 RepID=A0A7Y6UQ30_9HYPH|nr:cellulose biosynthesis cyclic di-GMP-binding regulatory protein BcsB [Ensifer oleiphilus]NVD42091.1 cellulose biosynthesis cyclic di-GMP-binding regulatory protein BcsB [Ensifer oleiphilus]